MRWEGRSPITDKHRPNRLQPGSPEYGRIVLLAELDQLVATRALLLGKPAAEEKKAHKTWPLSLRNPSISTWIRFTCGGWACGREATASTRMVPTEESALSIVSVYGHLSDSAGIITQLRASGAKRVSARHRYTNECGSIMPWRVSSPGNIASIPDSDCLWSEYSMRGPSPGGSAGTVFSSGRERSMSLMPSPSSDPSSGPPPSETRCRTAWSQSRISRFPGSANHQPGNASHQ